MPTPCTIPPRLLCSPARFVPVVPVNPLGSSWCMHSCRCSAVGCGSVGSWWLLPSPNSTAPWPGTTSKGLLAGTSAPSSSGTCPFPGGSTPSCVVAGPGAAQLRAVVPSQLPSWGSLCSQQLRACTLQLELGLEHQLSSLTQHGAYELAGDGVPPGKGSRRCATCWV